MGETDFLKYILKKVSTLKLINVVNKDKNETKHLCGTVIIVVLIVTFLMPNNIVVLLQCCTA